MIWIRDLDYGLILGIWFGDTDWELGLGNGNWGLGLGVWIGDSD